MKRSASEPGLTLDYVRLITSGMWDAFEPMWNSHNVVYNYLLRFFPWKLTSAEQQGFQVSQTQDFLSKRSDHFQKPVYIEKKKQTNKQQGRQWKNFQSRFWFRSEPMNRLNRKRCTHSLPHYLIHKSLTSSLISWPFNFFTDICIIQRRKKTIKSFLKTATSKSIVKRPGYQAIQVVREPVLFPVFLRRFKTENPGDETCLEGKVALRRFSRGFSWSIPTQFGYKLRRH